MELDGLFSIVPQIALFDVKNEGGFTPPQYVLSVTIQAISLWITYHHPKLKRTK
jgi:hypothetical protein